MTRYAYDLSDDLGCIGLVTKLPSKLPSPHTVRCSLTDRAREREREREKERKTPQRASEREREERDQWWREIDPA